MNQTSRNIIAEGAIAIALCVGVRMLLVGSAESTLASARASLTRAQSQLEGDAATRLSHTEAAGVLQRAETIAGEVREKSRLAMSESDLFAAIMALGESNHVRIDQVDPGAPVPPKPGEPAPDWTRAAYSVTAVGEFNDLVRFIDGLEHRAGYLVIHAVRVSPSDDHDVNMLRAVLTFEVLGFDPAPPAGNAAKGGRLP